jgi:hypothetical protein
MQLRSQRPIAGTEQVSWLRDTSGGRFDARLSCAQPSVYQVRVTVPCVLAGVHVGIWALELIAPSGRLSVGTVGIQARPWLSRWVRLLGLGRPESQTDGMAVGRQTAEMTCAGQLGRSVIPLARLGWAELVPRHARALNRWTTKHNKKAEQSDKGGTNRWRMLDCDCCREEISCGAGLSTTNPLHVPGLDLHLTRQSKMCDLIGLL